MTELTSPSGGHVRPVPPGRVLAIVSAGVVLASLDLFIVNVALPQIARDLGARSLGQLSWVLNGYTIVYASMLVFFGRLADGYRRDRGFLLGVAVFTVSSAACAAAPDVGALVAFRLVQAAGAALLTPTSLSLILASYEPQRRGGAVRAWTAVGGAAAALGPVVGGLLVAVNWRLIFLVNVPLGLVASVVGWRQLPAVPGHEVERPDPAGALLVTAGVAALTFGLVQAPDWGWGSIAVRVMLLAGFVLLALFALHCARSRTPLIHPSLFAHRNFRGSSLVAGCFSVAFGAMLLSVVLWEQEVWGWSALKSGLAIAPGPVMVPLVSFLVAGRLIARFGPALAITLGNALFALGVSWWALALTVTPNYAQGMLGGMVLTGVGVGFTLPTMMSAASASLPPPSFATGSAVVTMFRQTGLALGVAVLVAVLGTSSPHRSDALGAFRQAWWITAAIALLAVIPAFSLRRPRIATVTATAPGTVVPGRAA